MVKKPENMDPVEKKFEKFQKAITLANISNYLKHFNAIEQVVRRNVPAIIVEDDVIMAQDCDKLLNDIEIFEHDVVKLLIMLQDFIWIGGDILMLMQLKFVVVEHGILWRLNHPKKIDG